MLVPEVLTLIFLSLSLSSSLSLSLSLAFFLIPYVPLPPPVSVCLYFLFALPRSFSLAGVLSYSRRRVRSLFPLTYLCIYVYT